MASEEGLFCMTLIVVHCYSGWNKVIRGVPEWSVLGPLFFLIYINDLPGMINQISLPTLFADDTYIIWIHHNSNLLIKNRGNTIENKQMVSSKFINIKFK